jgi:hypothetical protein
MIGLDSHREVLLQNIDHIIERHPSMLSRRRRLQDDDSILFMPSGWFTSNRNPRACRALPAIFHKGPKRNERGRVTDKVSHGSSLVRNRWSEIKCVALSFK